MTQEFSIPDRPSKLDPFAEKLSSWLLREARKLRNQRKTVKLLYKDLAALGYGGSYERVAAFARSRAARIGCAMSSRLVAASSCLWPVLARASTAGIPPD